MLVGNSTTKKRHIPLRVSTLFSKFGTMENPTVSEYISSIPNTLTEALIFCYLQNLPKISLRLIIRLQTESALVNI